MAQPMKAPEAFTVCSPVTALRLLEDIVELQEGDVVVQNGANSAVGQVLPPFH